MKPTSFDEFRHLAAQSTFVPVCKELTADLLTPASAFLKIAEHSEYAFLLESVEGGEHVGRYSFLGKDPFAVLRGRNGRTLVERAGVTTETNEPIAEALRRLMHAYRSPVVSDLPRFIGGAVGYLGYEAAVRTHQSSDGAGLRSVAEGEDEAGFMLFDTVLAFDHVRHRILVIANARVSEDEDLDALYQFACARIQFLERELQRPLSEQLVASARRAPESKADRLQFERLVSAARRRVTAGEVDAIVVSQRFDGDVSADPFTVYRALRHVSPSPYMYFVRMGDRAIVGSSPEMLVRVEGARVETHPIAGTRPRGRSEDDDQRLAEELRGDERERATHVRAVEQAREDLSRVCDPATVKVTQFMALERYSHVMQLASAVEGRLDAGRDRLDGLLACCPSGTVTGAPKGRALTVLAELEPSARGVFAGAIGYVDCAGNLDFCVAIRTIVIVGRRAIVQAAVEVNSESESDAAFETVRHESGTLLAALELAEAGLQANHEVPA